MIAAVLFVSCAILLLLSVAVTVWDRRRVTVTHIRCPRSDAEWDALVEALNGDRGGES